jgi:hypothetical protein
LGSASWAPRGDDAVDDRSPADYAEDGDGGFDEVAVSVEANVAEDAVLDLGLT